MVTIWLWEGSGGVLIVCSCQRLGKGVLSGGGGGFNSALGKALGVLWWPDPDRKAGKGAVQVVLAPNGLWEALGVLW